MKKRGILKGAERKEVSWKNAKEILGEPFKFALDRFREEVQEREDFDPTALLQFALFMSMSLINILKEIENRFGALGQQAVSDALIKTGFVVGKQMIKSKEIPKGILEIELMSYLATIINTQAWASIEDPAIDNDSQCSFDIIWCPLQDIYSAFDCRVQRYMVQGIINAFRDSGILKHDYQVEFKSTIPAGAETCRFIIQRKRQDEEDKWELYSKELEKKALEKIKNKKKK